MQNMNEVSGRYTELPTEFYYPEKWRVQDVKNKQSSVSSDSLNHEELTAKLIAHSDASYELYEYYLSKGVAREQARMVLPLNIYTEIVCCWDIKNLLHFISLRDDSHAQLEIQDFARPMRQITGMLFPQTIEAFNDFKFVVQENV